MKLFSLLLSILVLTLTIVPCCAVERSEAFHTEELSDCHQDEDCSHDCSPFYSCGTCVGFPISDNLAITFAIDLKPVQHNSKYLPFQLKQTALSIWQPPQ